MTAATPDGAPSETYAEPKCYKCGSTNWTYMDEQARDCWDRKGEHVGTRVIGLLRCKDCGEAWLDYAADPCEGDPDCTCEDY